MIDPHIVVSIAAVIGGILIGIMSRSWNAVFASWAIYAAILTAISSGLGYPTNAPFPAHAIVYGLTADHVWAAPKEDPYPPRAYIFKAPPAFFEERDKRKGQPFEVEAKKEGEPTQPGANPSDRTSAGDYWIHTHVLPPKDEG